MTTSRPGRRALREARRTANTGIATDPVNPSSWSCVAGHDARRKIDPTVPATPSAASVNRPFHGRGRPLFQVLLARLAEQCGSNCGVAVARLEQASCVREQLHNAGAASPTIENVTAKYITITNDMPNKLPGRSGITVARIARMVEMIDAPSAFPTSDPSWSASRTNARTGAAIWFPPPAERIATTRSSADGQRSAGSRARQRSTAAANLGGTSLRTVGEWRRRHHELASENRRRGIAVDRRASGRREVGDCAERIEIASSVDRLAVGLLGTHVSRRTDDRARVAGAWTAVDARDAEVGHDRAAGVTLEENVVGLDVAVDDCVSVSVRERPRDLLREANRVRDVERATARDASRQRLAVDESHHEERELGVLFDRVNRHDVRVGQPCRRPRLANETRAILGVERQGRWQELDGDRPLERDVPREKHDAHAAAAELADDGVPSGDHTLQCDQFRRRSGVGVRQWRRCHIERPTDVAPAKIPL